MKVRRQRFMLYRRCGRFPGQGKESTSLIPRSHVVDPWQFMLQAEQLILRCRNQDPLSSGPGGIAADLRTAISRVYYATFLTAQSLLNDLGYDETEKGSCHGVVHRALIESSDRDLDRVASDYATLGEYRRKADYQLDNTEVEQLTKAEEMLQLCKSARSKIEGVRTRARNEVDYNRKLVAAIDAWRDHEGVKDLWKKPATGPGRR